MNLLLNFLQKTIGQKIVVALTGLALCLFVLIHMLGNLFILAGPTAYNKYAHSLHEFPLFILLELALLLFFVGHIVLGVLLMIKNKQARGETSYNEKPTGEKRGDLTHRLLHVQAGVLILFLIIHLLSFKFGTYYETILDGEPVRDIYKLVVESFKNPLYTFGYSLALFILFIHLLRGLTASFKSLGLSHPVYVSLIEKLAWLFAIAVVFGFLVPIWYVFIYL